MPLTPTEFRLLGALVGAARRDRAAARADRDRLARRRDRPRQHARRLRRAACGKKLAELPPRPRSGPCTASATSSNEPLRPQDAADGPGHGRRGHHPRGARPPASTCCCARTSTPTRTACCRRARRRRSRGSRVQGRLRARQGEPRSAPRPTRRSGSTAASTPIERPPAAQSVQRLADSLAGGPKAHAEDADHGHAAVRRAGRRRAARASGRSSRPSRSSPTSTRPRRRSIGSLIFAGVALLLVVLATRLVVDAGAASGRADDRRGGRLERARPRPPLQRRGAARRADPARGDLRQHARPAGVEPAPRAAASPPSSPTSCGRRWPRSSPKPSWRSAASAATRSTARRSREIESAPQMQRRSRR